MRNLTLRALSWTARRMRPSDDRGQATAEIIGWMALLSFVILGLSGRLDDILNRVIDTIDAALPG